MTVQLRRFGRTEKLSPRVTSEFKPLRKLRSHGNQAFECVKHCKQKKMLLKYEVQNMETFSVYNPRLLYLI